MNSSHVLKLFRTYNITYIREITTVLNYLGQPQRVKKGIITRDMMDKLIEKIIEFGWEGKNGRSFEMVKRGSIKKLIRFKATL